MRPLTLPRGETPQSAYELALRSESYFLAARIAQQYELGGARIRQAAELAIDRYLDHDLPDMALNVIALFGVQYPCASLIGRRSRLPN